MSEIKETSLVCFENISKCLTLSGVAAKGGRHPNETDLAILENATLVVDSASQTIVWVGPKAALPKEYQSIGKREDCTGSTFMPALVECHTHAVFAGDRTVEFAERMSGRSYKEIAAAGGGILTTVAATRKASHTDLKTQTRKFLEGFSDRGVQAVEIKSGYGLSLESEIKILEVVDSLKSTTGLKLIPTFLPAHAVPPEFKGRADDYVKAICDEWIPEVARRNLAKFFDVFVEEGYFSLKQAERMSLRAKDHKLRLKFHSEQFSDLGSSALGVELGCTSLDHLECISDANLKKIANSDTVAVLAPGAAVFAQTEYPPARKLIDSGVRVALTTDFNPGTCPSRNLPLMMTLACSQMGLSVAEAIVGVTYNAACALDLQNEFGTIEVGKPFRVCKIPSPNYESLVYAFGEV